MTWVMEKARAEACVNVFPTGALTKNIAGEELAPIGAMKKAGIDCEVLLFEGKPHGFFNHGRYGNKPYYETVAAADKFLASLGWLQGPPTLDAP